MKTEDYFRKFRDNIIGNGISYVSPYGEKKLIYADWVASGRLYKPIEDIIINSIGPFVANTHTETSETGTLMTSAYNLAKKKIKEHLNAGPKDVIINAGFGMTTVVNKFQRILGLKKGPRREGECRRYKSEDDKPVVFITHMEHHSNHTSWYETVADVVIIPFDNNLLVDVSAFAEQIKKYKNRKNIFASVSACSNVTGIMPPIDKIAKIVHEYGGYCFVDYAASAPYVKIDMHNKETDSYFDAVMFSPHKFLGGPGSSGVIVFNSDLYHNYSPDQPGGGTVSWTNPWGEYRYFEDIELREDGGTPGFIQAIRAALSIELKNMMSVEMIKKREEELIKIAFNELRKVPNLNILADNIEDRLGIISFYIKNLHYNLVVRLLSDRFGIQVRGGCACAGTYGHYLLNVDYYTSKKITEKIDLGDLSAKPGWVRLSLHPTMTDDELFFIIEAIKDIEKNHSVWALDYSYDNHTNEYYHKTHRKNAVDVNEWFKF